MRRRAAHKFSARTLFNSSIRAAKFCDAAVIFDFTLEIQETKEKIALDSQRRIERTVHGEASKHTACCPVNLHYLPTHQPLQDLGRQ
jgi:hypothetical protein